MTYLSTIINKAIESHLRGRGLNLRNQSQLREMIGTNIRRLNYDENVAVEIDSEGQVKAVKKVDGLGCLHTIDEGAFIISYQELERFFNEQQSTAVQF